MRLARVTALCCAVALTSARAEEGAAAEPKPKLALVPFATLAGVPARTGAKATGMLGTELKGSDAFAFAEPKKDKADEPFADALAEARAAVDEARALREKRKFRLAEEALKKAIAAFETGAPGLQDVGELCDAWALLSAVQFNTGRDDEGQKSLATALAFSPARELPLAKTSALFAKVVADAQKALAAGPKGTLALESTPAGAAVSVDAVPVGATPLALSDVPPGKHVWRAQLANGEVLGGVVEVAAAKQTRVSAATASKDPELRLMAALAGNVVDAGLVAAAKEYAQAADVDFLVFGALAREGKGLALDAFLFAAKTGEVRRLRRPTFDGELLSAGMEFFGLVGELAKQGAQVGEAVRPPAAVSTSAAPAAKLAEVRYGAPPTRDGVGDGPEAEGPAKDEPRKPLDTRRVPLKKK